jgi:hypothetical protein
MAENKDATLTTRLTIHIQHALQCALECSGEEASDSVTEHLLEAIGYLLAARREAKNTMRYGESIGSYSSEKAS